MKILRFKKLKLKFIFSFVGVNPKSLAGSRTAVYSVYDFSEMELSIAYTQMVKVLLGSARTFTANRLSFALDLHGKSLMLRPSLDSGRLSLHEVCL